MRIFSRSTALRKYIIFFGAFHLEAISFRRREREKMEFSVVSSKSHAFDSCVNNFQQHGKTTSGKKMCQKILKTVRKTMEKHDSTLSYCRRSVWLALCILFSFLSLTLPSRCSFVSVATVACSPWKMRRENVEQEGKKCGRNKNMAHLLQRYFSATTHDGMNKIYVLVFPFTSSDFSRARYIRYCFECMLRDRNVSTFLLMQLQLWAEKNKN